MGIQKKVFGPALFLAFSSILYEGTAEAVYLRLKSVDPNVKAVGEISIHHIGFIREHRLLSITLFQLEPNSTYTVWFRDSKGNRKAAGLMGRNHFMTDSSGVAHYTYYTDEYELWGKTVEIAYHADGDPGNTSGMKVVIISKVDYL